MKVKLGDYIEEYSVRNKSDEDIAVFSVTNRKGFCSEYFSKDVASKDRSTYKIVPRGYFAYNPSRINVGSIDFLRDEARVIVSPLYVVFKTSSSLDNQYLLYYLKSEISLHYIKELATGSVRDNLKFSILSDLPIELRTYNDQISVVNSLKRVDSLITLYQSQLRKLDELAKARFVEMFGDPVSNFRKLPEVTLPELGEFGRGVSKHRPRNAPELLGGPYPLIQTGDIANAGLYITEFESTYSELGLEQSKMWKSGTLCITIAANIAKTAILTYDACFPDSVVGFNANEKTNNIFIYYWFSFFQRILEAQAPESAQKNINLKILSDLNVIVPPLEEQNHFVNFVAQIDKSKTAVQQALDKTQQLFDSLMQQYFG